MDFTLQTVPRVHYLYLLFWTNGFGKHGLLAAFMIMHVAYAVIELYVSLTEQCSDFYIVILLRGTC